MLARIAVSLCLLALATISVLAISTLVRSTPAFSVSMRETGINGDWRVRGHWAMYHEGRYLRAVGLGYLRASQNAAVTEGPEKLADADIARQRTEIAANLFHKSLRAAPGGVKSWTALGWAEAMRGEAAAARTALQTSRRLAPFNIGEAEPRLRISMVIAEEDNSEPAWDALSEAGALKDLSTLARYDPSAFQRLLEESEFYDEMTRKAELIQ